LDGVHGNIFDDKKEEAVMDGVFGRDNSFAGRARQLATKPYNVVINQYFGIFVRAMTSNIQPPHLLVVAMA